VIRYNDIHFSASDRPCRLDIVHGRQVNHGFSRHVHRSYTVGLVLSGNRCMEILERRHILDPGTCFLINPGEAHSSHPAAADETAQSYLALCLPVDLLQPGLTLQSPSRPYFINSIVRDETLSRHMAALTGLLSIDQDAPTRSRCIERIAARLREKHIAHGPAPRRDQHIGSALAYLQKRPDQVATIDDLAAAAGLSTGRFCHAFKQRVGIPPYDYALQARVRMARELLTHSTSLADAACAAGFSDQSHLTRMFKRYTGITPGQYADQVRRCAAVG
jgi:AraC-like DNA-binding protein